MCRLSHPAMTSNTIACPNPESGFALSALPPRCVTSKAKPISFPTPVGHFLRSERLPPTRCNGFILAPDRHASSRGYWLGTNHQPWSVMDMVIDQKPLTGAVSPLARVIVYRLAPLRVTPVLSTAVDG